MIVGDIYFTSSFNRVSEDSEKRIMNWLIEMYG